MAIPLDTIDERPNTVEFAAGRVFYGISDRVYYSQLVEDKSIKFIAKCYQKNDPTSSEASDILATDGGVIPLSEARNLIKIIEFRNGVLLFASNGVWALQGPDTGFTATSFAVTRVTGAGCIDQYSVVAVEDNVYYWSNEGIYEIGVNEFGRIVAQNITNTTIRTFYNAINKTDISAVYDAENKTVEWFYSSADKSSAGVAHHGKDKSLLLDLQTGGFFPQAYGTTTTTGTGASILWGGFQIQENGEVNYLAFRTLGSASNLLISWQLATRDANDFLDLTTSPQLAYIKTAYDNLELPSREKTAVYVVTNFQRTEDGFVLQNDNLVARNPSSCIMQAQWNYANTDAGGKFAPTQQVYRYPRPYTPVDVNDPFDTGDTVITTKNKVRGRGKAISLEFKQEAGKDFQLLSYTMEFTVNGRL